MKHVQVYAEHSLKNVNDSWINVVCHKIQKWIK